MRELTYKEARDIVDGVCGNSHDKPLAVVVVRFDRVVKMQALEDGATPGSREIAERKARGALTMRKSSAQLLKDAKERQMFYTSICQYVELALSPGGILVADSDGDLIGAVGVSGDVPETDEACAEAGVANAGLQVWHSE